MATVSLIKAGAHRLRYLIAGDGSFAETAVITTDGSASPDTLTDSLGPGVIKKLSKVIDDGYGQFASGAQTQAKARALWLSDWSGADPGNDKTPTAICRTVQRTAGVGVENATVDADVSAGDPRIEVTVQGGGTVFLDVEVPGTIGA